ncbi:hypothetical protein CF161_01110 [Pseudomonas sp. CF161]|nr:hypothetical protein CF161_01110 [Pseudomonas sp. CF161]
MEDVLQSLDDGWAVHLIEHLTSHLSGAHDPGVQQHLKMTRYHRTLLG